MMRTFLNIFVVFCICSINSVWADTYLPQVLRSKIPPPDPKAISWVLMDQKSGWIIAAKEPDLRVEPASLSKLMTAYVVFDEIANGKLKDSDTVHISEKAWRMKGSRMFVKVNTRVQVGDLLKGLIVQSGNDAAVALAEHIAGSEESFVDLMNQTAVSLGLKGTQYRNSTGWPHPEHYSTARDITELTRALIHNFPEYYSLYSIESYTYNKITQGNRNTLLTRDQAVDGVKTGHTDGAGYCLVGSAEKDGMRLVATVMGTESKKYRADAVYSLLTHGFSSYEGFLIYESNKPVATPRVFKGEVSQVDAVVGSHLYVAVAKGSANEMSAKIKLDEPLVAPLSKGQVLGNLTLVFKGEGVAEYPLVTGVEVPAGSWIGNMIDSIQLMFH